MISTKFELCTLFLPIHDWLAMNKNENDNIFGQKNQHVQNNVFSAQPFNTFSTANYAIRRIYSHISQILVSSRLYCRILFLYVFESYIDISCNCYLWSNVNFGCKFPHVPHNVYQFYITLFKDSCKETFFIMFFSERKICKTMPRRKGIVLSNRHKYTFTILVALLKQQSYRPNRQRG